MFVDYYKFLSIHPGSNEAMIEDAYQLMLQKIQLNENIDSEKIEILEKAYKTLMNVPSRVEYDKLWLNYKDRKVSFISSEKPAINYFRASKHQFEVNEDITIFWETTNCDKVFLSVCGNVPTTGEYTFKVENDHVFYLEIELIGSSVRPFNEVSNKIRLNKASSSYVINNNKTNNNSINNYTTYKNVKSRNKFRNSNQDDNKFENEEKNMNAPLTSNINRTGFASLFKLIKKLFK